jgi:DNA-binding GntR family transcriptional regulator
MNQVSNLIKKEIIKSTMAGEKYITEADLCTRTGLSRTKLRETLKTLDSYGVIERKQKCGVALQHYTKEEIKELFELRILLESRAAAKTVANASERDLFELQQLDNEVEIAVKLDNQIEASVKDSLFHKKLIEIAGAKTTLRIIDALQLLESTMKFRLQGKFAKERDPYTHVDMIKAIKNKDSKAYKKILVNHIKWIGQKTLKNVEKE